jgi:uncharacterized protein (DUF169 family)
MADYSILELELGETLGLSRRPVAVTFREVPPPGVPKFAGAEPSGCSFWKIASGGMTFYAIPSDHYNCALGTYTHHLALPSTHQEEFEQTLSRMTSAGYVKMEEIPSIPRLRQIANVVVYSPLGDTPTEPDLTIFVVRPMQAMVLQESALRTGISLQISLFGRPACMALPSALQGMVTSGGCLGNRIYSELGEDELYVMIAGRYLRKVADEIQIIAEANSKLTRFHQERKKNLKAVME